MKRLLALLSSITILTIFLFPMNAFAASATASMSGTGAVHAGDTITVTFYINNPSDVYGGQGTLSFSSSQLVLQGDPASKLPSPWDFGYNEGSFTFMNNGNKSQYAPLSGSSGIFSATFTVKSGLAVGTTISVSATNLKVSDGNNDFSIGTASYSATIAAPVTAAPVTTANNNANNNNATTKAGATVANLPSNSYLASLTASNATLSPAFNKNTTKYTTTVDYSVAKLSLAGTTEDSKATLTVAGNTLAVGTNNVTITVKAQNGATKVYTITVSKKDANGNLPTTTAAAVTTAAVGANNSLSGIAVTGVALSPAFSPNVKSYVIYLPYETTNVALAGTPADSKATVKVTGGTNLAVGDNTIKVICTAENGKSTTYTICAKRAAKWGTKDTSATKTSADVSSNDKMSGAPIWLVILLCVLSAALAAVVCYFIFKKKMNNDDYYGGDDDDNNNNGTGTYNDINYNKNSQSNSSRNNTSKITPSTPVGLNTSNTYSTAPPPVRANTTNAYSTTNPPVSPNTTNTYNTPTPPVRPNTTNTPTPPNTANSPNTPNTSSFENNAFFKQYIDSNNGNANSTNSNDNNAQNKERKGRLIKNPFEQSADD